MMSTENPTRILCANLSELVKRTLRTFCEINVKFASRLEIRGSVHVQADGDDVVSFLLDEKCVRPDNVSNVHCVKGSGESHFHGEQSIEYGTDMRRSGDVHIQQSRSPPLDWRPKRRKQTLQHRDIVYTNNDVGQEQHPYRLVDDSDQADGASLSDTTYTNQQRPAEMDADWQWSAGNDDVQQEKTADVHLSVKSEQAFFDMASHIITSANDRTESTNETPPADDRSDIVIDEEVVKSASESSHQPCQVKSEPVDGEHIFPFDNSVSAFASFHQDHPTNGLQATFAPAENTVTLPSSADKLYVCELCPERFHTTLRLKVHMSRWHRQVPAKAGLAGDLGGDVRCLVCQSTFTTSDACVTHANSCHFPCRLCSKFFSTKQARDSHFRADHQHVRYSCPVCCVCFKTKDGFRCHMNSQHNRSKLYDCAVCQRRFYTRQALYSHKKQVNHCTSTHASQVAKRHLQV